jgi:hypothetical protein
MIQESRPWDFTFAICLLPASSVIYALSPGIACGRKQEQRTSQKSKRKRQIGNKAGNGSRESSLGFYFCDLRFAF